MKKEIKIEPCPTCKNDDHLGVIEYESGMKYVECDKCWYRGKGSSRWKEAVKYHNLAAKEIVP